MTVNDAITKLRVMLGASTEEVVKVEAEEVKEEAEIKMAEAVLVDGTSIYTEGAWEAGAIGYIRTEEEQDPFMPQGIHETADGLLIQVGENGAITSIEEKAEETEEVAAEEEIKEEVEMQFNTHEFVSEVAELIKPYTEEISNLKEELNTLTERFEAIADQPAGKKIRNNFSEEAKTIKNRAEARYEKLLEIRKNK
jgi:vacuolar-type H+-ATPase subunit I/STV1